MQSIGEMTVQEIFEAVDCGVAEVHRRLASGVLDGSGRYYTDEELAAGEKRSPKKPAKADAA